MKNNYKNEIIRVEYSTLNFFYKKETDNMSMSNYLENKVLNHIANKEVFTAPTNMYLALLTSSSNEDTAGTEVVASSYSRQAITFDNSTVGELKNSSDIVFDVATESWGSITSVAIFDDASAGNMLFYSDLAHAQNIDIDNQVVFKIGKLSITLD